ncbi:MAG: nitrate/nitrite transporter NrtS [Halieaceae bacterium]|jgi:hypothetical protein|nr:nitrate/nitrite transporter NrtS [Halieaceae bacterium]
MSLSDLNAGMLLKATKVAVIVGSILLVINQFNALFGSEPIRWLPAALTYCVPFCVFITGQIWRDD